MLDWQPGNGYRYVVFVSTLPCDDFQGGNRDTHRVVTIWMPGDRFGRSHIFAASGPLTDYYVAEKLRIVGLRDDLRHASDAIRRALGREDSDAYTASFERFAKAESVRPGRGRVLTDLDILKVAVRYSRLVGTRGVYKQLTDELGCSTSHARNMVYKGRKAGYLEPTVRGKTNFNLTPLAHTLIEKNLNEEEVSS
jgi:hypothetical protein